MVFSIPFSCENSELAETGSPSWYRYIETVMNILIHLEDIYLEKKIQNPVRLNNKKYKMKRSISR